MNINGLCRRFFFNNFFFVFNLLQTAVRTKNASFIRFAKATDQETLNVFARPVALR